jgi:DNA repair protein RecO
MYHIYHTHGLVIASRDSGEANRVLTLYTKEMGLVRVLAQGIILNKSKLKFSLQLFSYAHIDLVRGKDFWRLTSARSINTFSKIELNKDRTMLVLRIFKLLERLNSVETQNDDIFEDLIFLLNFLNKEEITKENLEAVEINIVLRILKNLGYIGNSKIAFKYTDNKLEDNNINNILIDRKVIVSHINKALSESQL